MTTISTIIELYPSTAASLDAVMHSAAWKTFNGWMTDQLRQLEITWQASSSPKAWNETDRHSRRSFNR